MLQKHSLKRATGCHLDTLWWWIGSVKLDQATIKRSFDQCGITAQNMANYGSQLRHFVRSNELVDNVDLADEANHEMFQHGAGDSWEPEEEDTGALGFR